VPPVELAEKEGTKNPSKRATWGGLSHGTVDLSAGGVKGTCSR